MFYDNLKAECDRQGLKITPTVLQVGGKTGALSGWKNGASPNSDIVMKLAKRLNVTTDYLLFGKDEDNSEDEHRLIKAYRKLTEEGQRAILTTAELYASSPQYQKYTDISKEA